MARHLIKFRWKTVSIAVFFFLLGNLVSLFFVPINRKCIPETGKSVSNVMPFPNSPYLVVIILSAPNNMVRRNVIRETWWNLVKMIRKDDVKVKYYFVIGDRGLSEPNVKKLKDEYVKYNDILRLPMYDAYSNLTEKVIKSFDWLIEGVDNGNDFKYVLKCDDDSFVRIDHLIHELVHLEIIYLKSAIDDVSKINDNTSPYISVNVQLNTVSSHGNRDLYWGYMHGAATIFRKGKWKEPSWISCDHYIPYALGGGYVISKNLVKYIAKSQWSLRHYHSEDVSVGAWLAPVNNIVRIHDRRFDTEYVSRGCQNYYLVRHNIAVDEMKELYSNLKETQQLCTEEKRTRKEYVYDWSVPPSKCCERVIE